uniref:Uncharacterized protein n=1 Tax=Romanomermis culicivorax TaxID=13658 RepID=A0A915KIR6_ROMCU
MHIGPIILSTIWTAIGVFTRRYECRSFDGKEGEKRSIWNEIGRKSEVVPDIISVVSSNGSSSTYIRFSERSIESRDRNGDEGGVSVENVVIEKGGDLALQFRPSPNIANSGRPLRRLKRETLFV